ncbi:hypothetical protein GGH19_004771 [Coemansia sp. RSA 1807]|nr:hypothetical protein GGH19_004771 [Coemansia sp. RSA 1807]
MIDDVTGELAYHVYLATQTDNKHIGFTVNLHMDKHTNTLVVGLDFGPNISGPPIYVHGGILATVLYNASALLFAKTTKVEDGLINASVRDVNYYKGVPLECQNTVIEARVETQDEKHVVVFAKLVQGSHVFTTLKTTFTLQSPHSKL